MSAKATGGKYLAFRLDDTQYAVRLLDLREIIGAIHIASVPGTPEFVKGVINLRGRVIPVYDLRGALGLDEKAHDGTTCIIVVNIDGKDAGVVVDRVEEVLDIAEADIAPSPIAAGEVVCGMATGDERVTLLLDVRRAISGAEWDGAPDAAAD